MKKYKIGIVPNIEDEALCQIVIDSLEEPMMTDLFIPILYMDKASLDKQREGRESDTKFLEVADANSAREECVCVVNVGKAQDQNEGNEARWKADLYEGRIDALVYAGDVDARTCIDNARSVVYLSESACMALVDRDNLTENLPEMIGILERDLDMTSPRLAVIADTDKQKEEWEEKSDELRAFLYGPFLTETFFEEDLWQNYDAMLALDFESAIRCFRENAHAWGVCLTENAQGNVSLYPAYNTQPMGEDAAVFNSISLNRAFYTVVDVMRSRERYDVAHKSPLPKLFHEKREDRRSTNVE